MPPPDRPRLRPYLALTEIGAAGRFAVWDQLRLSDAQFQLSESQLDWLRLFDGSRTLRDIQAEAMRQAGGRPLPLEVFQRLAELLDEALFLDGPRFRERAAAPVRQPACIGVYEGDPEGLRRQLPRLFTGSGGPGLPGEPGQDDRLRAVLIPHIDYARGRSSYGWAFKELFEHTRASLFVIIGTSHHSPARFTLTRKHFATPLGVVETDGAFIDRLVAHHGDGLFDDELRAHLPEHSVELEVVLLHYLYEKVRPIRIVPLVVGSFGDCVQAGQEPSAAADVARMVEALRAAERETPEPVCYVISGDLAHIGPKFGDPLPVGEPLLGHSRARDQLLLRATEAADAAAYFRHIAAEQDERRICGLPPTWLTLQAARPARGRTLAYDQYVDPRRRESVSFASVAFDRA
jgi:AmmeMemoRadiSam system protein B